MKNMNLKYYLRGLGIGVIMTAVIMGIAAGGRKETLTDDEIRERARALGMTEESIRLADMESPEEQEPEPEDGVPAGTPPTASPNPESPSPEKTASPAPTAGLVSSPEKTQAPVSTPAPEKTPAPDSSTSSLTEAQNVSLETQDDSPEEAAVTIQVNSGDSSFTVCSKLEEAGLIELASDFDRYLYENGYDKRINVGTYEIPAGADQQQIAKILARME